MNNNVSNLKVELNVNISAIAHPPGSFNQTAQFMSPNGTGAPDLLRDSKQHKFKSISVVREENESKEQSKNDNLQVRSKIEESKNEDYSSSSEEEEEKILPRAKVKVIESKDYDHSPMIKRKI